MKACRDCGIVKPLADYYRHKAMGDGHLNKCKACVKARVNKHRADNVERIRAYDRKRYAEQPHRQELSRRCGRNATPEQRRAWIAKSKAKYPERRAARGKVNSSLRSGALTKQPCEVCGSTNVHAHHDDYSRPLDVRWLCPTHHGETWRGPRLEAA